MGLSGGSDREKKQRRSLSAVHARYRPDIQLISGDRLRSAFAPATKCGNDDDAVVSFAGVTGMRWSPHRATMQGRVLSAHSLV